MSTKTPINPPPDEFLTVQEAATLLKFTTVSVRTFARANLIPAHKIAGSWRFSRNALMQLINSKNQKTYDLGNLEQRKQPTKSTKPATRASKRPASNRAGNRS